MRIIFLARRYPPSIGGIQTHCYNLFTRLNRIQTVTLLALSRESLLHLCWYLPWIGLRTWLALMFGRVDVVYFGDGVVSSLAPLLKPFRRRARFVVTVYGTEMTYGNVPARSLMKRGASCCEYIVVISENSKQIAMKWGLPPKHIEVVYVGVEPPAPKDAILDELQETFEREHNIRFGQERVLLNIGRQVKRKGLVSFLEQGFPLLEKDIIVLMAGGGPEMLRLHEVKRKFDTGNRILIIESPNDEMAAMLRRAAGLFLMPNISLVDDIEGYGITPLESMLSRTPVIAFAVDALVEAVREGGYLVPAGDYQAFADQIHKFFSLSQSRQNEEGEKARDYVLREYSWDKSTLEYVNIFNRALLP